MKRFSGRAFPGSVTAGYLMLFAVVVTGCTAEADDEPSNTARQTVIVVVGAEGMPDYGQQFRRWAERWKDAAERGSAACTLIGLKDNVIGKAAHVSSSPGQKSAEHVPAAATASTGNSEASIPDLELLQRAVQEAGQRATSEPLWLVLIGHGTFDTRSAGFSLRGPDLTADQLREWCDGVQRPVHLIDCSSCSGPFLNALSGENRIVITATKDGQQVQFSRFGDAMSQAIAGLEADIDRDGQTSLLEAWLFAARRTADFYVGEGRLATEHSLLDDNGDRQGTRAEKFAGISAQENAAKAPGIDGAVAGRRHLVRSQEESALTPEQREIRDQFEARLAELRDRSAELEEAEYLRQLEQILLPLARLYESLTPPAVPD